jgi:predicted  nucleic acid-binding Zn-ribbon protein
LISNYAALREFQIQGDSMARKVFAWILLILSGIFLLLSIAGIITIWVYNKPLTDEAIRQLEAVDDQLEQAQGTLASSQIELDRALRIVDSAQEALDKFKAQTNSTGNFLETIQSTLDDRLLPELKTTHERIDSARTTLEQLQSLFAGVQSFLPIDLSSLDKTVSDLIASANSIDSEISNVEVLGQQASLFVSDSSYILGGDLTETRESLKTFLAAIKEYQEKMSGWRDQVANLKESTPHWIDQASIALTVFLIWFAISQFGLLLHGLNMRRGGDPFLVMKRTKVKVRAEGAIREETIETVEQE